MHSLCRTGRSGAKVFLDGDLFLAHLVGEDEKGGVDALVDVDGLLLALAFVGVGFDGFDEVGDAADALFDGGDELHAGDEGFEPIDGVIEERAVEIRRARTRGRWR